MRGVTSTSDKLCLNCSLSLKQSPQLGACKYSYNVGIPKNLNTDILHFNPPVIVSFYIQTAEVESKQWKSCHCPNTYKLHCISKSVCLPSGIHLADTVHLISRIKNIFKLTHIEELCPYFLIFSSFILLEWSIALVGHANIGSYFSCFIFDSQLLKLGL